MLYVRNFKHLLSNISAKANQTALFRAFGAQVRLTANPETIANLYSDRTYTRAEFSQRVLSHTGASNTWVAENDQVAAIKRNIHKSSLNQKNYQKILKRAQELVDQKLTQDADLHWVFYKAFETAFLENLLGVKLTSDLKNQIDAIGLFHQDPAFDTSLIRLFFLNYFSWVPQSVKNVFTPELVAREKKFQQLTNLLYNTASADADSVFSAIKLAEQEGKLTHEQALGELRLNFINANTLAGSLCWAVYLLSKNPGAREKAANSPDYAKFSYMETLRLYPPFHMLAYQKKTTGGCPVHFWKRKDTEVVSILATHRSSKNWDNPMVFDPDRFASGMSKIKRGSYIPFGGGDRACPGTGLAMSVAPAILQFLAQNYRFELLEEPVPKRRIELIPLGNRIKFRITKT